MTNYNDLKNAGTKLVIAFEENLDKKSEEKAQKIIEKFNNSRGLWALLHIGIFIEIILMGAMLFGLLFKLSTPISMLLACAIAVTWWRADFTKNHPLISSILAVVVSVTAVSFATT
jgi:hypothetical protein